MLSPSQFHEIVSGRRQGIIATAIRAGLRAAEVPYTLAVQYRNRRFDRGHTKIHKVSTPVISIGNLTMGGTGKTPMVAWVVDWCLSNGFRPSLLSRGYGAPTGEYNDEGRELATRFPNVPHIQNPDRVAGARQLVQQHTPDVIILDDGFQHRRLHRDLDIILIDALQPFGFGHVFPRGSLREPLEGIERADVAILTRADSISDAEKQELRTAFTSHSKSLLWLESTNRPTGLVDAKGNRVKLSRLSQQPVIAFCAIGNPDGFRHTLAKLDCHPRNFIEFPDHHQFGKSDLERILRELKNHQDSIAVCTCKDLVKLQSRVPADRFFALEIRTLLESSEALGSLLLEKIKNKQR